MMKIYGEVAAVQEHEGFTEMGSIAISLTPEPWKNSRALSCTRLWK